MKAPERRVSRLDALLLGALVFLPKFDLLAAAGGSLRIDDLVLVAVVVRWRGAVQFLPRWLYRCWLYTSLAAVGSLMAASLAGRVDFFAAALYVLRPLEYGVAVLLGIAFQRAGCDAWVTRFLAAYTMALAALSALQVAGWHVGVSRFDYGRAAGNLGGPYELAAVASMLTIFFAMRRSPGYAMVAAVPLLLSGSRVSLIATVLVLLSTGGRYGSWLVRAAVVSGASALIIVGSGTLATTTVERIATTEVWSGARAGCDYARAAGDVDTAAAYEYIAYARLQQDVVGRAGDVSSAVRFARWCLIGKSMDGAAEWALGLGPSFAGASVDGQYVRYVAEGGLFGLAVWLYFWVSVGVRVPAVRPLLATLLLTALFIDILAASRPMILFWFLAGSLGLAVGGSRVSAPGGRFISADATHNLPVDSGRSRRQIGSRG